MILQAEDIWFLPFANNFPELLVVYEPQNSQMDSRTGVNAAEGADPKPR